MILVDSSVWIDFFRDGKNSATLEYFIQNDLICTNEIILSELLPALLHRKRKDISDNLLALPIIPYSPFWEGIRLLQKINLESGISKVGLADLMIAQNCMDNNLELWSFDKHFQLMSKSISLKLFKE